MKLELKELLNEQRKLAGLEPLVERVRDEDDDEDRDAKIAANDPKQKEFEAKNKKTIDDADAEIAAKKKAASEKAAKKEATKDAKEPKAEEKKDSKAEEKDAPKKADDKKADTADEKVAKVKKAGAAKAWLADNPSATAGQFKAIAEEKFGMGKHYANTFFYAHKGAAKKAAAAKDEAKEVVAECYVLSHPSISGYYLAENKMMNQYQWVDENDDLDALIFETEDQAKATALQIADWRGTHSKVTHVLFND